MIPILIMMALMIAIFAAYNLGRIHGDAAGFELGFEEGCLSVNQDSIDTNRQIR